jgi:hypothetical protein
VGICAIQYVDGNFEDKGISRHIAAHQQSSTPPSTLLGVCAIRDFDDDVEYTNVSWHIAA